MKKQLWAAALVVVLVLPFSACSHAPPATGAAVAAGTAAPAGGADPYLWLEQIEDPMALSWVRAHNAKSLGVLEKDERYPRIEKEVRKIVLAQDRIPWPALQGEFVYNFWQDEKSVRGLWRRTPLAEYEKTAPRWETVIDLDQLAVRENENWVWKGAECLAPEYTRCMLRLSRGGKDASVIREFDAKTKTFVPGGFVLPEAKSDVSWLDANRLLVATDFGPESLTAAGYPRTVKVWTRGEPLASARSLKTVPKDWNEAGSAVFRAPGENLALILAHPSFFEEQGWIVDPSNLDLFPLELPRDSNVVEFMHGQLLVRLRTPWTTTGTTFPAGSLVAITPAPAGVSAPVLVWAPDAHSALQGIARSRDDLLLTVLEDVKGRLLKARPTIGGDWTIERVPMPDNGLVGVAAADPYSSKVLTSYEDFLTPTSVLDGAKVLKRLPKKFDARKMVVEQHYATSRDGTRVPYFEVHRKGLKLEGANPTLLYGYGGFEIPMTPSYAAVAGRVWLERGGVYALANIRGGGEFGPAWHQAALKENRQRAYDDFAAVASDLISRRVTSPAKLGIMGGSNGGLLMGAAFTQHPELYGAVVCKVPLLDMLRYNQLLAGYSWEGEYGNPADPALRDAILAYSPYQNVRAGRSYPEVFFETSTKDDRVHPGHARKMVARMEALGYPVYYFENIEGGHGAAANLEQKIHMISLDYTYLSRKLGVK